MVVRIFARSTLIRFVSGLEGQKDYRAVKFALEAWYQEAKHAKWRNSAQIKRNYANASIVGSDRVVFNIKGNSYRLVVGLIYARESVFIKWIGTQKDYDEIDVRTVNYESQTNQE